jgi:hypothetical protein
MIDCFYFLYWWRTELVLSLLPSKGRLMGRRWNPDRAKNVVHADDPVEKLIGLTSFGSEFFLVSEAVPLLGIRTVGDLPKLDAKKLLQNPSLNPHRAQRLVGVVEKWQKLQSVMELTEQISLLRSIGKKSEQERDFQKSKHPRDIFKASKISSQKSREAIGQHNTQKLFSGIDPKGGEGTIHAAVLAIVRRLQALPTPRSLCELGGNSEDYRWLCEWAWDLTPQIADKWLAGFWSGIAKGADAGGSLLLLLAAEAARREAREGHVWPAVENKFQPRTQRLLFVRGHPTPLYKEAIEAAARLWKLRHVFGLEGTQNYYVSIYLQFGFTQKGLAQLPFWLAGYAQTAAIQHLLDSAFGSATFTQLWSALRDFRQNRITEKHLRQTLETNPWVLPEWVDEIVLRAREKLEIDTPSTSQAEANDDQPLSFLEPSRLQWDPPAEPLFVSRPINLSALGLSTERYEVRIGSRVIATLLRQPDETYLLDREALLFPCEIGQPVMTLVDDMGSLSTSISVDLWEPTEDVTVYELPCGRRLDAWKSQLNPGKTYVLLTAPDLEIQPSPAIWRWIGGKSRKLSLLSPDWSPQLQALLDGEVLWMPHVSSGSRQIQPEPAWVRGVQLISKASNSQVTLGEVLRLRVIGLSPGVQMDFVRLGTQPLDFKQNGELVEVNAFSVTTDIAASGLNFTLGLRQGDERVRIRRTIDHLDIVGGARLTEKGWELVDPRGQLTVQEARLHTYKLFLPRQWKGKQIRELGLIEGTTYSRQLGQKPRPLGTLAGFGAPLVIRGPYNWNENVDVLKLARTVVDPGVIQKVECYEDSPFLIHLRLPIEPGAQHQVVCWSGDDGFNIIPLEHISVSEPTCWQVGYRPLSPKQLIVAIAYAGERLGSWWPANLEDMFNPSAVISPTTTAALVRWMHLPILQLSLLPKISAFARYYPAETLATWLLDKGLPEELSFAAIGEEWLAAIHQVFADRLPEPEQAQAHGGGYFSVGIAPKALQSGHDSKMSFVLACWNLPGCLPSVVRHSLPHFLHLIDADSMLPRTSRGAFRSDSSRDGV